MSRALIIVHSDHDRLRAANWCRKAPVGCRIDFKEQKRSNDQNAALWAALTDIASQKEHCGRKYSAEQWKVIFLAAIGREVQFIPSLDCKTFIPWGQSSSDLSRKEMSDLIEFIQKWAMENDVVLHHPEGQQ